MSNAVGYSDAERLAAVKDIYDTLNSISPKLHSLYNAYSTLANFVHSGNKKRAVSNVYRVKAAYHETIRLVNLLALVMRDDTL